MLTKFPNGITSFGVPVIGAGSDIPTTTGSYFFVDSTTGSNGNSGETPTTALATIDSAVGKCTANKGDVIVVMPGHTETITTAGGLDLDVAGITVVGLGTGTLMPKVKHDAAAADVDVDAANITVRNIKFVASFADVAISIDANADDLWLDGCVWEDEAANLNFVDYIHVGADNAADGLKVTGCRAIGSDAANDGFINAAGDIDKLVFIGNYIKLNVATTEPVIEVTGKSLTNCLVTHNYIERLNLSGIVFIDSDQTDNSGIIAYNVIKSADADAATPFDVTGAGLFENYQVGVNDASGLLLPAVDDNS
jgi:hypothetical protein